MKRSANRRIFLCVAAGILGYLVNLLAVPIFGNVVIIFGGILYLLVALLYGPIFGSTAALIASVRTVTLFQHPYGLLTFALEGFVFGWLVRRRVPPLFADLLYWGIIGIPLVIFFLYFHLNYSESTVLAIVIKLPLNGLLNVILAELILSVIPAQWLLNVTDELRESRPLRAQLLHALVLLAVLPILFLSVIYSRNYAERQHSEATYRLQEAARAVCQSIDDHLNKNLDAVVSLASAIRHKGSYETEDLNQWLEQYHNIFNEFSTMLAAGKDGNLIGAHPLLTKDGRFILAVSQGINDRDYFIQPMATGQPYVSNVFLGRGYGQDPIVAVSAPVLDRDGTIIGIVEGSLNFSTFRDFGKNYQTIKYASIIITDQNGNVIYSGEENSYKALQHLSDSPLMVSARLAYGKSSFYYDQPEQNQKQQIRYIVGQGTTQLGWRVFIQQPQRHIQEEIERYYLITIVWIMAAIGFSILFARMIAGNITRPIEQLVDAARKFNITDISGRRFVVSGSGLMTTEVAELVNNFSRMGLRLNESYSQLQKALAEREVTNRELQVLLASLDQKVQERTAEVIIQKNELAEANIKLQELDKIKARFTAMLVHDLKSPLSIIKTTFSILEEREQFSKEEIEELIEASNHSIEKIIILINDMLEVFRSESQDLKLFCIQLPAEGFLRESIDEFSVIALSNQITLSVKFEPNLPMISIDPVQFGRVISNLLSNAIKFTPRGGAIEIKASAVQGSEVEAGLTGLLISIADTGEGIPASELLYIFDPFRQSGLNKSAIGVGLGLAIVKRIVTAHGGNITVHSEVGVGTCFNILIPTSQESNSN
jgi:two-component system, sensor histidine kinase